jgi:hypothetical protein
MKKNKQVFILYNTDAWHSKESKQLLGIFTSKEKAIMFANGFYHLDGDFNYELFHQGQTQGLDENFIIEKDFINKWYK